MHDIETLLALQAAQQPDQHRIELEELPYGRSGSGTAVSGNLGNSMNIVRAIPDRLAEMIGHDVHRVSPVGHGFGDALDPDRSATRPGERTCGNHGDAEGFHGTPLPATRQFRSAMTSSIRFAA